MSRGTDAFNWLLRSRETGRITVGQPPNLEQKIFSTTVLAGTMLPPSKLRTGLGVVSVLTLTVWAIDELARGVNPFRRILGVGTLGGLAYLAFRRR